MTNKLKSYSATPASNNAASPDGWPEGMAPSGLNNSDREFAARVREFYVDSNWIDYGDAIVSSTSTTVLISGDVTAQYITNRAIRAGQSESYVGYVSAANYSAPNTSITCAGLDLTSVAQLELGGIKRGNQMPNDVVLSIGASTTAATQTAGDSSTKIATTAFVTGGIATAIAAVTPNAGAIVGGTSTITAAYSEITGTIPLDDTVPLVSEGTQVLSVSYATNASTNTVEVLGEICGTYIGVNNFPIIALFAGSTCVGAVAKFSLQNETDFITVRGTHSPGTTTATTYSMRYGDPVGSQFNLNGYSSRLLGGSQHSSLIIREIKA